MEEVQDLSESMVNLRVASSDQEPNGLLTCKEICNSKYAKCDTFQRKKFPKSLTFVAEQLPVCIIQVFDNFLNISKLSLYLHGEKN